MFKEIFPILICLSHHKNRDIALKVYELYSLIKKNIIADIFNCNIDLNSEKYTHQMLLDEDDCDNLGKNADTKDNKDNSISLITVNCIKNKIKINQNCSIKEKTVNSIRKSSDSNKQSNETHDKKFDLKIENLQKLILQELAENRQNSQVKCLSKKAEEFNKHKNACLLRNSSTPNSKEYAENSDKAEKEAINNFEENVEKKQNEKVKIEKNTLNVNDNYNNNKSNFENVKSDYTNTKSGFLNCKGRNKQQCLNKENIFINENCFIDNTNLLTTETYNIDSSVLSMKENNLININLNSMYQSSRIRRKSSVDNKEKNKETKKRKDSNISKSIFSLFLIEFIF
jgi:hypothetical protein